MKGARQWVGAALVGAALIGAILAGFPIPADQHGSVAPDRVVIQEDHKPETILIDLPLVPPVNEQVASPSVEPVQIHQTSIDLVILLTGQVQSLLAAVLWVMFGFAPICLMLSQGLVGVRRATMVRGMFAR
jgi:hypothetical protein